MTVERVREREVTFAVDEDWAVPDLSSTGLRSTDHPSVDLTATYYDTEASLLRRLGVTLRHRTGGADDGWHLKVPDGRARTEMRSRARGEIVPDSLRRRLGGAIGGEVLRPVATITTTRRTTVLRDEHGVVAEIADDVVAATTPGGTSSRDGWHEVEVELGPVGTEQQLTMITDLFGRSGASISPAQVKLIGALGAIEPSEPEDTINRTVVAYVREQCRTILLGDIALRDKVKGRTVHQTRVAIRRLRSALRTLAPLFDSSSDTDSPSPVDQLDEDLRWLAAVLGPIRDGDVISRRLLDEIADLPPELVLGPIVREISETAATDRRAAIDHLERGRGDERYLRTLATIAAWYADVPVRDTTLQPTKIIKATQRKVRRRLITSGDDVTQVHGARKAAKRLRYTAEAFTPIMPKATKIAHRAKEIQTTLGEHQDLVVVTEHLRRLTAEHGASAGHNGFTYGLLHANAAHRAAAIRADLRS